MILKWGDIMYTLSWHQEGDKNVNQAHSRRAPHAISKDSSIDPKLTPYNITLVDEPVRQAYHRLFDAAVDEYNDRARKSRQIRNYYTYIGKTNKQQAYEAIVQLGSKAEGSPAKVIEAYKKYITDWQHRNPNMVLIGAYIHMDEPEGTIHMHINYIPVAVCSRGMQIQNSLTRALASQGFKTQKLEGRQVTAQIQWEQAERDCMREICRELGIDLHKQGIGRKRHLSVREYKDCQDQIRQAKTELASIESDKSIAEFDKLILMQENKKLRSSNQDLKNQVTDLQKQISVLSDKRQEQHNKFVQDREEWTKFRTDNFDRLEWLESFQNCINHYDPEWYEQINSFLDYNGLDSEYWPECWPDDITQQYIDDNDLEL